MSFQKGAGKEKRSADLTPPALYRYRCLSGALKQKQTTTRVPGVRVARIPLPSAKVSFPPYCIRRSEIIGGNGLYSGAGSLYNLQDF